MVLTLICTCKHIYRINIDTLEVTLQPSVGDLPGPELGSSLAFYDNSLYLFGYYWASSDSSSRNTLYAYDLSLKYWRIMETGTLKPSARAFHSSFVYNSELYILYGMVMETSQMLNSVWKYSFSQNSWINVSAISGDELGYTDMSQNRSIIYSVFGLGTLNSYNWVFSLDLSESSPTRTILSNNWDSPVKRKNHCSLVINSQMLIFGGIAEDRSYLNDVWSFDFTLNQWTYLVATGQAPTPRELAGCGDTGRNALLIFGGRDSTKIYNDLYQNSQCVGCPPGKYSTALASTSSAQCMPCALGTFTNYPGSTYCVQCPSAMYCPIGSDSPIDRGTLASYQSIQPASYKDKGDEISNIATWLWYAAILLSAILVLIAVIYRKILEKLKDLDVFVDCHSQELNVPIIYRKTQIGGLFSIFFLFAAAIIISESFINYYFDNITEMKSLIPVLLLEPQVSAATVNIAASFYLYGGICVENSPCFSTINILESGISYTSRYVLCSNQGTTCTVDISYKHFYLISNSVVHIQMLDTSASATSMSVNVTSTSSIPGQQSSVFIPISTGSDELLFLGTNPTVVSYEFTPSVISI